MASSKKSWSVYVRGTAGLICAILSLALGWIVTLLGLLLGILAMALGFFALGQRMRYGVALGFAAILLGLAGYLMSFVFAGLVSVLCPVVAIAAILLTIVMAATYFKRRS